MPLWSDGELENNYSWSFIYMAFHILVSLDQIRLNGKKDQSNLANLVFFLNCAFYIYANHNPQTDPIPKYI